MNFAVIITSYNQPEFLKEAILSCFNQNFKNKFQIVVVDDSDKKSCVQMGLPDRPEIDMIYIKNEKNLGVTKSYNIGCYYVSNDVDYIIRLDGDDQLLPNALQDLEDFLITNDNRRLGFVYSDLQIMETDKIRIYPEYRSGSILDIQKIGHLQAIKKSVAEECGYWDTSLKYGHDTDAIIRLIEKGYQIKHIPKVLYSNRLHDSQFTKQFVRQGNDPVYWKNLIFNRSLSNRCDLWIEGRQNIIMQTSGSQLWQSEVKFIRNFVENYPDLKNGNTADIGCSNKKKLNYAIGIDLDRCGGKVPELVLDASEELPFRDNFLDGIIASHVIEHIIDPVKAIQEWLKKLKVGGILMLIVPNKQYIPNIGSPEGDPTHKADYLPVDFKELVLDKIEAKFELLSFDKINNNWSFDCFIKKL